MNLSTDPINTLENLIAKNKTKSVSLYLIVVLALLLLIGLTPFIKVDISSQSRGVLRSTTDPVPLISIVSGKITHINLRNNREVHVGDTLLVVWQEALETEKKVNDTLFKSNQTILTDLKNLLNGNVKALKTALIRNDYQRFVTQKNVLEGKVHQAKINHSRFQTLYDKGVIAKAEFEKYLFELQFSEQERNSYVNQQKANWQNQINELELSLQNIEGQLNKLEVETNNYYVLAPVNGTIENFIGVQSGSYVYASQAIAQISPNDQLIVETTVAPSDIGLIYIGQSVNFQLDAFNYNQWGLLTGKVVDIDQNISIKENQAFFKVRCILDKDYLQLKTGHKAQVKKGMTLTARYVITNRSIYQLIFDKVDDWINPKQLNTSN